MPDEGDDGRAILSRRGILGAGAVIAANGVATAGPWTPVASAPSRLINVLDFGARADGVNDDTDAFNRATRASEAWSEALECTIVVPPGRYRIDGTVYVRKGQTLKGAGVATIFDLRAAKGASFVLGRRRQPVGAADPGGSPVGIAGIRTIGGAPSAAVVTTDAQGFSIDDIFMSGPGIGIEAAGADGRICNVTIDQGLNGVILRECQNLLISNIELYLVNYGLTIGRKSYDIIIANSLFCYSPYAAILFSEGADGIANINVSSCVFAMNEQYPTFSGFVHVRASNVEARFSACAFRNWSHVAVNHGAGAKVRLSFNGCAFDALQSNPDYNGTSASAVLASGPAGEYEFNNCSFRNLSAGFVQIGAGPARIVLDGGTMHPPTGSSFNTAGNKQLDIAIRNMDGIVAAVVDAGGARVLAPWWAMFTSWIVDVAGLVKTKNGSARPFAVTFTILVNLDKAEPASCVLHTAWKIAPFGEPKVDIGFGDRPGGPKLIEGRSSGVVCVYWDDPRFSVDRLRVSAATID